jgi:hypothetical protein
MYADSVFVSFKKAKDLRETGNRFYRENRIAEAVNAYTKGLENKWVYVIVWYESVLFDPISPIS